MSAVMANPDDMVARSVRSDAWRAESVDPATVQPRLTQLWSEVSATDAQPPFSANAPDGAPGGDARSSDDGDGGVPAPTENIQVRATTLNLIGVAREPRDAARIERAVTLPRPNLPSRVIVLMQNPHHDAAPSANDGDDVHGPMLDVRLDLLEQPGHRDRPAARFEVIRIESVPAALSNPVSIISPLLVPDLPDFLWWPGDILNDGVLFRDLVSVSDRVIVDSASLSDPGRGLSLLANLTRTRPVPNLTDFAWSRLAHWRQLVAQFFDQPDMLACLEGIREVSITYAAPAEQPRSGGSSGLTAATLLVGWLATRLGWTSREAPDRTRLGLRIVLQATRRGQPIIVRLRPEPVSADPNGLGSITLSAQGTTPGTFRVHRTDEGELVTSSELADFPPVGRVMHADPPDDATLLTAELQHFGRDRVFEESLVFAADLFERR